MKTNANTAIYDKSVDRAAMIRLYEKRVSDKVGAVLDDHEAEVTALIQNSNVRRNEFNDNLQRVIAKNYAQAHNVSSRSLFDLVADQTSYIYQNLEAVIGQIFDVQKPATRIAEDIVLNQPLYNNTTLIQGWGGVAESERKRIEGVIRRGIAEGWPEAKMALEVRKGNVFNISRNQSFGLVRTAITSVHTQVDYEVYKANEKALVGWQYVAVLDSRTTPICAHRDGTVYPIGDTEHLPPAHFHCRSTTVPVVKSWEDLARLENVAQVRRNNLAQLTDEQKAFYDGQTPLKESYDEWLRRQPTDVQLRHLGDYERLELYRSGQLQVDRFTNPDGNSIGIRELRQLTDSGYAAPGDTRRFALAKEKLDTIHLPIRRPDDVINSDDLAKNLREYYLLQSGELDGTLSLTNYRGTLLGTKKNAKNRVLATPPTEDQLKYNPLTGRYDDVRMYQPQPAVLDNALRLVDESTSLTDKDKQFIKAFQEGLADKMGVNERAVVTENLRITFGRYRDNKEPWNNFKAVTQSQIKFDVMNVSDFMETQIRKDTDVLKKLKVDNFIDPVLGAVQLQDLHDTFIPNIKARNNWEDKVAPKIAKRLRNVLDRKLPPKLWARLSDDDLEAFYLRFANRLAMADSPDRDQLAVALGRDLYNLANYRGSRYEWYNLGLKLLDDANDKGFYKLDVYGVQKRRMKSRLSNNYFGPYYDTQMVVINVTDPDIREYSVLSRKVDVGLRIGVTNGKNKLIFRPGYKTYFVDEGLLGYYDTRIPITSSHSFSDFPVEFVDEPMADALNWASSTKYKVDPDFHDAIQKILNFKDDRGKAQYYDDLNSYRKYIVGRGDAYERFKSMEWLRGKDAAFSNHAFLDHRARIYDRGFISPQSGETFRPFLNSAEPKFFSPDEFDNLQDQIGAFLGGLSDKLEGKFNSLSVTGRQGIAQKWRSELIKIGDLMRRGKPNDIRAILENEFLQSIDGEEQGKALRFAIEMSKIDEYLGGDYSRKSLERLREYEISLALEQDASSSGAQIIALTTKNKQLAQLSNVVPTSQKQRLYDEIAASTFNDPRFRELNLRLGLTEKDLRKAAKAQNMVTFYGAGERTGILNVEGKLAKVLGKQSDTLVVKASDRDKVLNEISARMARYEKFDPDTYEELKALRQDVKDIFNKGLPVGQEIMDQLYFLDPKTKDVVEKMSQTYDNVVTPQDFALIAGIMSENLRSQVPILKDFTKFFGRLAEDFLTNAKPSKSVEDFATIAKRKFFGERKQRPPESLLKRIPGWNPIGNLADAIYGVAKKKLPKKWTNVPWVNFDGKAIEQNFTQTFEEKLLYKGPDGKWVTNIIQVPQKTDPTWWEEFTNKEGTINDIADVNKARTAFAVNGNHSNDAVIVKQFHLWGKQNDVPTSTIHDAFFTNAADMLKGRYALREIYARMLDQSPVKMTLDEMYRRGLPRDLYQKYLNEAIDIGLIPVVGRSRVGGKLITADDVLTKEDILAPIPTDFKQNLYWYGVG